MRRGSHEGRSDDHEQEPEGACAKPDGEWKDMVEVNWRKWLFRSGQAWKVETVHEFLDAAWGHLFHE